MLSWILVPCLGFTIAACALNAIVYALMTPEKWNARFNPEAPPDAAAGHTNWLTIGAIVASLMIGAAVLMASIVFSFQRYFEYQIEEARKISQ
jgi:phosphate/sulfate permease